MLLEWKHQKEHDPIFSMHFPYLQRVLQDSIFLSTLTILDCMYSTVNLVKSWEVIGPTVEPSIVPSKHLCLFLYLKTWIALSLGQRSSFLQ